MILFKVNSKSSIYAHLLFSMAVLCLLITLGSCSKDDVPAEIIPNPDSENYFTKSLDFTSDSGEAILSFTTNKDWAIDVSQSGGDVSWCTIFPNKGKAGENQVMVKVAENKGFDDRNVTLTLTAKDLTRKIVVTQKQKDAITLTTAKFEIDQIGGEIKVDIKANVSYEIIIPEQYQSWIRHKAKTDSNPIIMSNRKEENQIYGPVTKAGMESTTQIFRISKSEKYDKREGEIIFQSGNLKEVLKVYQSGGGILLLTKNEYRVSDKGEQIAVELKSNFDFDVKMPQVNWITTTVTRSVSSHTLYYTIAPNKTYDKREAEIIYYDRNNKSVVDTLKIIQTQKDAILLSKKEYNISANGEIIEILVNTNINFNIKIDKEASQWITLAQSTITKGLRQDKFLFKIEENIKVKDRVGNIVFITPNEEISDTIWISQKGKKFEKKHVVLNVEKAGTLRALLGTEKDLITHLELSGDINGTDLRVIREMAGIGYYGDSTLGQLTVLDLTKATICSGGTNYSHHSSSTNIANTIPASCFYRSNLISIYLPLNLKSIQSQAFFWSKNLKEISIPTSCRSIGNLSFGVCAFTSIDIPQNVSSIHDLAFDRCYDLTSINVDSKNNFYSSIDGILHDKKGETLIYYPAARKTIVYIPKTVKKINRLAFYDCIYQKEINIPSGVVDIPYGTFMYLPELSLINVDANNTSFTSIDGILYDKTISEIVACPRAINKLSISNKALSISPYAFYSCQNLKSINMPHSITTIGERAFWGCINLSTVDFSENVTSIGDSAFGECTSLVSVSLPESITGIESGAFCGCINLIKMYLARKTPPFIGGNNVFWRTGKGFTIYVPKGCKELYRSIDLWKGLNIMEME